MSTTGQRAASVPRGYADVVFGVGDEIDDFTVDEFLGSGASAEVYRVHRGDDPHSVALKVLRTGVGDPRRARERFEREFTIASLLHHPHIVGVFARGEITDPEVLGENTSTTAVLWTAMEYIDGTPASAHIAHPPDEPDMPTVLAIGTQIAEALDYAHGCEVLHRDVKPANIMVSTGRDGVHAVLTDFGIAQFLDDARPLARNGRVQGSIAYAAPELLTAQHLSPATDLYAFAVTMFEMLTGQPPFPRATAFAISHAHLYEPIPRLTAIRGWLPSSLNSVFAKALAKDPADRYDNCAEFVAIVVRALRDVPVPETPVSRRWGWRRSRHG